MKYVLTLETGNLDFPFIRLINIVYVFSLILWQFSFSFSTKDFPYHEAAKDYRTQGTCLFSFWPIVQMIYWRSFLSDAFSLFYHVCHITRGKNNGYFMLSIKANQQIQSHQIPLTLNEIDVWLIVTVFALHLSKNWP